MHTLLKVLHVEDEPNDAELVRTAAEADGIRYQVEVVSTREEFLASLGGGGIDLILSDYSLPAFDGLSALRLARETAPDVPFIFVSGTLGEEAAIECVRAGATDYVLKHRLAGLPTAMRRAVGEATERRRRRHAEEELQNKQQFLEAVLESLDAGVVVCDSEGVLTLFNRAAREFHGLAQEPLPPERWAGHYRLYQPDGKTPMDKESIPLFRALQGERVRNAELVIIHKDGAARTVLVSGQPITDARGRKLGAVAAMLDITERKRLEAQFLGAQKMEAVGRLAGGVAHDFNNLLTVITGYSDIALHRSDVGGPLRKDLEEIKRAGERAAALTRQLLAFSRRQVLQPRVVDLNPVVSEMDKMLRRLIGEDIELVTVLGPGTGRVRIDPGQLEQVVMNLAVNARDAMPQGGRLTIETRNVDLDETYARQHPSVSPGPYVLLAVSDEGCGMDEKVLSHIFEPFFTTKEKGKGTGLGLATVYGIVKQSGGNVWVYSEPGRGTSFKIYLPRVEAAAEAPAAGLRPGTAPRGTETILLVEDEEVVRDLCREVLSDYGYTVLATRDSNDARNACRAHAGPIHLLLTDVVMPSLSGSELAQVLGYERPDMRVLFMSGYTDDAIVHHGILGREMDFLQKPFAPDALARKVREVLDREKTGSGAASGSGADGGAGGG